MKDGYRTTGLIALILVCCSLIGLLPNFNVLPDRRSQDVLTVRESIPTENVCHLSNDEQDVVETSTAPEVSSGTNYKKSAISFIFNKQATLSVWSDEGQLCKYQTVHGQNNKTGFKMSKWSPTFTREVRLPQNAQHFRIYCKPNGSQVLANYFTTYIPQSKIDYLKKEKEKVKRNHLLTKLANENFSVVLISLKGINKNGFNSFLKQTRSFLMTHTKALYMKYHSQFSSDGWRNLFPMLTGKTVKEKMLDKFPFFQYTTPGPFIWELFRQRGYVTFSSEDDPQTGVLSFSTHIRQSADLTTSFLVQAFKETEDYYPDSNPCLRAEHLGCGLHLDYVIKLFYTFPKHPIFSYVRSSLPTHISASCRIDLDNQLLNFLRIMSRFNFLDKTFLFLVSDSGQTQGTNQSRKVSLPMYILPPIGLASQYPQIYQNLMSNSETVTGHFDLHSTFLEILGMQDNGVDQSFNRQSLLQKIQVHRSCETLNIEKQFCPCL